MGTHDVTREVLEGTAYDVDEDTTVFVFDGFAFRRFPIGSSEEPYYDSFPPTEIPDATEGLEGAPVSERIYKSTSRAYVHRECRHSALGVADFLIDETVYRYEETFYVNEGSGVDALNERGSRTEYVRLSNGWSDVTDVNLPRSELEDLIDEGEILRLWPIWESASR